jgi:hypothetical protein
MTGRYIDSSQSSKDDLDAPIIEIPFLLLRLDPITHLSMSQMCGPMHLKGQGQ